MAFEPRQRAEPRSEQVIFRLRPSERKDLVRVQEREGLETLSDVLRLALAEYMERHPLAADAGGKGKRPPRSRAG